MAPLPAGLKYFTVGCSNLSSTTYTVTATGIAGTDMAQFSFTIDQGNTRQTTNVPAGWTTPATNCWVMRKNGTC